MARGRKSYTLEEKLDMVNTKIEQTKELLNSLRTEKKELEEQIKNKQLNELFDIINESDTSFSEIKELLKSNIG